jgi:hypothetical protein
MLMTMKAYTEGMRALAYWVGILIDVEDHHPDATKREEAVDLVALMTPVIKAFCTYLGFEIANMALQCFGGHGYIREYGMEQFVRDARIAQIYEGPNGVQAMDLLGRKIPEGNGRLVRRFVQIVEQDLASASENEAFRPIVDSVRDGLVSLVRVTSAIMARAAKDPDEIGAAATDYLRLFGLVATGWMWVRMAVASQKKGDTAFAAAKLKTAQFYATRLLPQAHAYARQIDAGAAPVMALDASEF